MDQFLALLRRAAACLGHRPPPPPPDPYPLHLSPAEREQLDQLRRQWMLSAGQLATELAERDMMCWHPVHPWDRSSN